MTDRKRPSPPLAPDSAAVPEELAAIPLLEERLSISKRQIESGRVRVHVTVEEREETVTEQLSHDELQIDRVPRNVRVTDFPEVRLEGDTTIIPVVEEILVVEKALLLVEEIHICRRSVPAVAELPVTLRAERATVERDAGAAPATAAE